MSPPPFAVVAAACGGAVRLRWEAPGPAALKKKGASRSFGLEALAVYITFQFTGGAGSKIGVDKAINIAVHHGGDVAVCPSGCASPPGTPLITLARAE